MGLKLNPILKLVTAIFELVIEVMKVTKTVDEIIKVYTMIKQSFKTESLIENDENVNQNSNMINCKKTIS